MKSKIEVLRKIARMLYEFFFVLNVTIFFENVFFEKGSSLANILILVGLYICSFFIREAVRVPIYAILLHGILLVVLIFLPLELSSKVLNIVVLYYLCMTSISHVRLNNKLRPLDDIPWPSFSVIFLMYLIALYKKCYAFLNCTYVFVFLMLVTYYFISYLEGLVKYMDSSREVEEKHLKRVIARNNRVVSLVVVLLVVSMVVGCLLDYHKLEAIIMVVVKDVLTFIVSVCMIFGIFFDNLMRGSNNSANAFDQESMLMMKQYAGKAGNSFDTILYIVLAVICIVIIVKFIKFAVRLLLSRNKHQDDVVEIAEKVVEYQVETKKKTLFKRLSDEDKLRKKYKEFIQLFKYDIRLSNTRTCRDIAEEINNSDLGEITEITEIYSQIRYGNRKVDRKLLKKVNDLCKSKYH